MFDHVITERIKNTLAILGQEQILKDCYLAGGTATLDTLIFIIVFLKSKRQLVYPFQKVF